MPVDSKHRQYQANWVKWRRVRDVVAGEDAVKARGESYLPRLEGQDFGADGYHAYRDRAEFHEAAGRTLDGLTGAIFRKEPMITVPAGFADRLDRVTPGGLDFVTFAKLVVREVIAVGRYGVLVDTPGAGGEPFLAGYTAESIINWRTTLLAAVHMATMTFARRLGNVENIQQQDSAERAFNKLARTFAAQMEALRKYRTGGEQKVTVKHVTVNEGGQAIVGNVSRGPGGAE